MGSSDISKTTDVLKGFFSGQTNSGSPVKYLKILIKVWHFDYSICMNIYDILKQEFAMIM